MGGTNKSREFQETTSLRSTSLRRDNSKTPTPKKYTPRVKVGCMSGIFGFVSKYQTRHKFLTFGNKKQEREATTSRKRRGGGAATATCQSQDHRNRSSSAEVITLIAPRSPGIPAEIRRWSPESPPESPPAVAEKRRKVLLGALEKCDEDLQELKRIIKAVRDQSPSRTPPRGGGCGGGGAAEAAEVVVDGEGEEEEAAGESEEPSPVSVLDYHHRVLCRSPRISCAKRSNEWSNEVTKPEFKYQEQPTRQQSSKQNARDNNEDYNNKMLQFQTKPFVVAAATATTTTTTTTTATIEPPSRWSNAMRETVIEVCKDLECGLRLEIESLVLVIQNFIVRELVDEVINELEGFNEALKRKLSF